MGTFLGHAAPGLMLILYALWNAVKQAHNRVQLAKESHPSPGDDVSNSINYMKISGCHEQVNGDVKKALRDVPLFRHDVLVGGAFFLLCSIVGALGVIGYGGWSFIQEGVFRNLNNYQHGTMFVFFGIHFSITILSKTKYRLEDPGLEKLFLSLAFFVEALLFFFHLHDRSELDVHVHILLIIAILGSALCTLAEVWTPGDPILENGWVIFLLLHGMWFFQIGFMLYNPFSAETSWNHDERSSQMMATVMFTWMLIFSITVNSFVRWVVVKAATTRGNHPEIG